MVKPEIRDMHMINSGTGIWFDVAVGILAVLILSACNPGRSTSPEELRARLEDRVARYLEVRSAGNTEKEYEFFQSEYRKEVPRELFVSRKNVQYRNIRLEKIEYQQGEQEARVILKADVKIMGFEMKDAPVRQRWVLEDGLWFIAAKPPKDSLRQMFSPAADPQGRQQNEK
ncbi:MAG TPA: hypothetical protein EYP57_03375 [Thermodesulfobacteriaceae bacterium]|nr:hypothetical protein [Thermodesulfobacteriaceae bacterium]